LYQHSSKTYSQGISDHINARPFSGFSHSDNQESDFRAELALEFCTDCVVLEPAMAGRVSSWYQYPPETYSKGISDHINPRPFSGLSESGNQQPDFGAKLVFRILC
jgi:hypothetical protein